MLCSLSIRNMLLLENMEINFSPGLNVFTGETGAGKSIILECLGFVLGKKSKNRFLRTYCDRGEVVAVFMVRESGEIKQLVDTLSIEWTDTLIIRRVEFLDGRRKAYINDISCTLETVQKIGAKLVEFVDQKDGSSVLKKSNHINLLDDFSGNKNEVSYLKKNWDLLKEAEVEISTMEARKETLEGEIEFMKYSLSELKSLAPKLDEVKELKELQTILKSSSRLNEHLQGAGNLISEKHIRDDLFMALSKLEKAGDLLPNNSLLSATISSLDGLIHELDDIEKNIPSILSNRASDGVTLEEVEDRLFNLKNIARKHGVKPEDLVGLCHEFEAKLSNHIDFEGTIRNLRKKLLSYENTFKTGAEKISKKRKVQGKKLDIMMQKRVNTTQDGGDLVQHMFRTKKGQRI
ncbi:MAG: AAA family ATPase [Paracoccaceae bacterium]